MIAMKVLFVGESWSGSSARSIREALIQLPGVRLDDIGEDHYFPKGRSMAMRLASRLLNRWHRLELARDVTACIAATRPEVLMVYKGTGLTADVVRFAKAEGVFTVNLYPDMSPHTHGKQLKDAMGIYDLVVSTKPFHPAAWKSIYGYANPCVCVPHGYDPTVHYWAEPPVAQDVDVVLVGTCRPEYEQLMIELANELGDAAISVKIGGNGWNGSRSRLPAHWQISGPQVGRAYGEFVRRARVVIAPVNSEVVVDGARQPGDEDSTRTYELAAAGCFFLHRRTPYALRIYDESTEVPMWDTAAELAALVRRFLPDEASRRAMAAKAHARAVPAYSIPGRAKAVLEHVQAALRTRAQ